MKSLRVFIHEFFSAWKHASKTKQERKRPDTGLVILIIGISLFGILMVYDSSLVLSLRDFNTPYHYVYEQIQWLLIGYVVFFIFSRLPYVTWKNAALPALFVTLILLVMVFIPGLGVKALGASRWISVGPIIIQPSELAKASLVLYLSVWFVRKEKGRFGSFILLLGMVIGLILLQPDMGTAMILTVTALGLYFMSGAPLSHFAIILPLFVSAALLLAVISPYRFARLTTFMNPEHDPLGAGYQIRQSLLAIGSGGLTGIGIGMSRQKYEYLPEANTDSIFAIVGEEFGFIGTVSVVAAYVFLILRGLKIASAVPDRFGKLFASGITYWLGIQAFMNIAASIALIPLTGIPLPLISSGGSNLIVMLAALGILVNISTYAKKE